MPQPRRHKDNAAKQKAYRERVKARAIKPPSMAGVGTPGTDALTHRIMAADKAARGA